jgi:hypothetical protein
MATQKVAIFVYVNNEIEYYPSNTEISSERTE